MGRCRHRCNPPWHCSRCRVCRLLVLWHSLQLAGVLLDDLLVDSGVLVLVDEPTRGTPLNPIRARRSAPPNERAASHPNACPHLNWQPLMGGSRSGAIVLRTSSFCPSIFTMYVVIAA